MVDPWVSTGEMVFITKVYTGMRKQFLSRAFARVSSSPGWGSAPCWPFTLSTCFQTLTCVMPQVSLPSHPLSRFYLLFKLLLSDTLRDWKWRIRRKRRDSGGSSRPTQCVWCKVSVYNKCELYVTKLITSVLFGHDCDYCHFFPRSVSWKATG